MKISVEVDIDTQKCLNKVDNDGFWTFAAYEWWRLITPYVPMETGTLSESVEIRPKEIEYIAPYAHYLYRGELMVDPVTGSSYAEKDSKKIYTGKELDLTHNKHPLSSKEWDKAAEPSQKPKLIQSMQGYLHRGG